MFGEGVNDNQTLPYYYYKISNKNVYVKNYGMHGWGVNQVYLLMSDVEKILSREAGEVNVLQSGPWQSHRSACFPEYSHSAPKFELSSGNLILTGRCWDVPWIDNLPDLLRGSIRDSNLLKIYMENFRDINPDKKYELYIALVLRIKKLSEMRGQKFVMGYIRSADELFRGAVTQMKKY